MHREAENIVVQRKWIKVAQAAENLGVSSKTVRRRVKAKQYHAKKVKGKFGPELLLLVEDLEKDVQGSESPGQAAVSPEIPTLNAATSGQENAELKVPTEPVEEPTIEKCVLIVDDCEEMAASISSLVEERGHRCVVVKNGEEALDHVKKGEPDLVISELALPLLDGFQFASQIEKDGFGIPIAFCSYHKERSIVTQAMSYRNVVGYFAKPLIGKQLKLFKLFVKQSAWEVNKL